MVNIDCTSPIVLCAVNKKMYEIMLRSEIFSEKLFHSVSWRFCGMCPTWLCPVIWPRPRSKVTKNTSQQSNTDQVCKTDSNNWLGSCPEKEITWVGTQISLFEQQALDQRAKCIFFNHIDQYNLSVGISIHLVVQFL